MDPYVYEGTDVLINKMNIRNAEKLIDVEAQLFIANVLDIKTIVQQIDFRTHKCLLGQTRFNGIMIILI